MPLPPNIRNNSPLLFGFFTYEFAIGHDRGPPASPFWSTSEGRYGPSLVLTSVQHPPPPLLADPVRRVPGIRISAEPARAYHDGLPRTKTPKTQMWMILYARVRQADDLATRNVQIDARRAVSPPRTLSGISTQVETAWSNSEMSFLLRRLGLPRDTPLSLLAVELLPEPNGTFVDPVGNDLGQVRILRTSPLAEVPTDCCV